MCLAVCVCFVLFFQIIVFETLGCFHVSNHPWYMWIPSVIQSCKSNPSTVHNNWNYKLVSPSSYTMAVGCCSLPISEPYILLYKTHLKMSKCCRQHNLCHPGHLACPFHSCSLMWMECKHLKAGIRETTHTMFEKVEFRVFKYLRLTECIFGSAPDRAWCFALLYGRHPLLFLSFSSWSNHQCGATHLAAFLLPFKRGHGSKHIGM